MTGEYWDRVVQPRRREVIALKRAWKRRQADLARAKRLIEDHASLKAKHRVRVMNLRRKLAWRHGEAIAADIVVGRDALTEADIAAWNTLGEAMR